jgi:hypothetical protein
MLGQDTIDGSMNKPGFRTLELREDQSEINNVGETGCSLNSLMVCMIDPFVVNE